MAMDSPTAPQDMAQPPASTAAAKVFATPELLEHILLNFAQAEPQGSPRDSFKNVGPEKVEVKMPVKALHVLQRIDKTTRNIIRGSSKLRRLMWIDMVPPGTQQARDMLEEYYDRSEKRPYSKGHDPAILAPLIWLLFTMRREDCYSSICYRNLLLTSKVVFEIKSTSCHSANKEVEEAESFWWLSEAMLRPKASWRSLRVLRTADTQNPITFAIVMSFNIGDVMWMEEHFNVDQETTLGDFHNWHLGCLERDLAGNCRVLQEALIKGTVAERPDYRQVETEFGIRLATIENHDE